MEYIEYRRYTVQTVCRLYCYCRLIDVLPSEKLF